MMYRSTQMPMAYRKFRSVAAILRLAFLGSILPSTLAIAAPGAGTTASPIVIDAFPYIVKGTTVGKQDSNSTYACGTQNESGPEVIYQFKLAQKARVTAWLLGDSPTVDVDIHILKDNANPSSCVARSNQIAEADLDIGTHYLAVDTFGGDSKAGAYILHVYAVGDAWYEQPIAQGVTWRARRYATQGGGPNQINELVVDLATPGCSLRAIRATDCEALDVTGRAVSAVAAINGGYWNTGSGKCEPVSLLKSDGALVATNASTAMRGAFGISETGMPMVQRIAMGADWPAAYQAHGGGPVLVDGGNIKQGASAWAEEGLSSTDFLNSTRARTYAGFTMTGLIHLGGVDEVNGSSGMSMDSLATFVGQEAGLYTAVNMDGGGSTTVWINGATPNGVVSYPTDFGAGNNPGHSGLRGVSGGFFVFAEAFNWSPRFQTTPGITGAVGTAYSYDADAIDLDPNDSVSYSLVIGPPGLSIDGASGVVTYQPDVEAPSVASVTIHASDGHGGDTDQSFSIAIAGAMGTPDPVPDAGQNVDLAPLSGGGDAGTGGRDLSTAGDVSGCTVIGSASKRDDRLGLLFFLCFLGLLLLRPMRRIVAFRRVMKL